jgi:acetamidase/formamidase
LGLDRDYSGFGLLAGEFPEPAIKIWRLEHGYADFAPAFAFLSTRSVVK